MYCFDPTTLLKILVWSKDLILVKSISVSGISICVFPGLWYCWPVSPPQSCRLWFCSFLFLLFFFFFFSFLVLPCIIPPTHWLCHAKILFRTLHCSGLWVFLTSPGLFFNSCSKRSPSPPVLPWTAPRSTFTSLMGFLTLWMPPVAGEG